MRIKAHPSISKIIYAAICLATGLGLCVSKLQASPLEQWHWRNPLPQGNALNNVVFANGKYVAVGELGTILVSADGTNWTRQVSGVTTDLRDCAYGDGKFIVVGDFGTILTSTDTIFWTNQYAGTFLSINAVVWGAGKFVAVGESTLILTSSDGLNWNQNGSGSWDLLDVTFGDGLFVAVGGIYGTAYQASSRVILTSPDGAAWNLRTLSSGSPYSSVAFGAGKFVLAGSDYFGSAVWTSEDGIQWETTGFSGVLYQNLALGYGAGHWVLSTDSANYPYYGVGLIYTSTNLWDWTLAFSNSAPVSSVAFGTGGFVASRTDGAVLISSDGAEWANPLPEPTIIGARDLKFLNGRFVGVSTDGLDFSDDGFHWTNHVSMTNALVSITYGNGRYVAGGEYGTVWISDDGLTWTNPAPDLNIYPYLSDVFMAHGNGVFVGVAGYEGNVLTSPDGINWNSQTLETNGSSAVYFRAVTFGNDRFVAVSDNAVATSTDGTNWFFNDGYYGLESVAAGNGIFVAVGNHTVSTSTDGTNWVTRYSGAFDGLDGVAFGQGFFVAVGAIYSSSSAVRTESSILISTDGVHWFRRPSNTPRYLSHVEYGDGTFVVSAGGGILQSDPLVTLALDMQPDPRLVISGPSDRPYFIEWTDTLNVSNSWKPLTTVNSPTNPICLIDADWTNSACRFYRATLLP